MKPQVQINHIQSSGSYQIPFYWYEAKSASANIIFMAALGVPARFYLSLAETLQQNGFNVMILEQRGHGESAIRASRQNNYGFKEALTEDIPFAMDWLNQNTVSKPLFLMGHSLGGHYASMCTALYAEKFEGAILVACGTPWVSAFEGKTKWQLSMLCFLLPMFKKFLGYYPGDKLGFGGREASSVMDDWLSLAKNNIYSAKGITSDFETGISEFQGRVLTIRMQDDHFAPQAAMDAVSNKLKSANIKKVVLSAEQIGDRADHFRWARNPAKVAECVAEWIKR